MLVASNPIVTADGCNFRSCHQRVHVLFDDASIYSVPSKARTPSFGSRLRVQPTSSLISSTSTTAGSLSVLLPLIAGPLLYANRRREQLLQRHADRLSSGGITRGLVRFKVKRKAPRKEEVFNVKRKDPRKDEVFIEQLQKKLIRRVAEYLEQVGGECNWTVLTTLFQEGSYGLLTEEHLSQYFDIGKGPRNESISISLKRSLEIAEREVEQKTSGVIRHLFRRGGSGQTADVCRRFGISKRVLLQQGDGQLFEEIDGQILLKGGARSVAAAAKEANSVTVKPGTRKTPTALFTSVGIATDQVAARRLLLRIEGLLVSAGDGVLPSEAVYRALGLTPSHSLRRWFPRAGLKMSSQGNIAVHEFRLAYYRIRRSVTAAAILAEARGEAPLQSLLEGLYRPPELVFVEEQEGSAEGRAAAFAAGLISSVDVEVIQPQLVSAEEFKAATDFVPVAALPAPQTTLDMLGTTAEPFEEDEVPADDDADAEGMTDMLSREFTQEELSAEIVLAERSSLPPLWIEAWVREYFVVDNDTVYFPYSKPWQRPINDDPEAPLPPTFAEEEGLLMAVEEELWLSYGRTPLLSLSDKFKVRKSWVKRFFDVTPTGEVIPKSIARQTKEAIAVASRIIDGGYTVEKAFEDFGVSKKWLRLYFTLDETTGALGLDDGTARAWEPPSEEKAPNPFSYARLNAPRGYVRKVSWTGRYGHKAGGILY